MKTGTYFTHDVQLTDSISSRFVAVDPFGEETHRYEHYRIEDGVMRKRLPVVSYDDGLTFQELRSSDSFEVLLDGCKVLSLSPQELQVLVHTEYLASPVRM